MSQLTINRRWVIIDTCAISKMLELDDKSATQILNTIKDNIGDFTPVITWLIRFEFLRKSKSKTELEKFNIYLNHHYVEIEFKNEDDEHDIYKLGCECACVCRLYDKGHAGGIGLTDYMHHGLLRRYPQSFYILTFDNNDFPSPVFETVSHGSSEVGKQIEAWSLKKINKNKFTNFIINSKLIKVEFRYNEPGMEDLIKIVNKL